MVLKPGESTVVQSSEFMMHKGMGLIIMFIRSSLFFCSHSLFIGYLAA
jgi:hypothetical protein